MRIDIADKTLCQKLADIAGLPYQTYLRSAIHRVLEQDDARQRAHDRNSSIKREPQPRTRVIVVGVDEGELRKMNRGSQRALAKEMQRIGLQGLKDDGIE